MEKQKYNFKKIVKVLALLIIVLNVNYGFAQDSSAAKSAKPKPVKGTFASSLLIDNETVYVPNQGSMIMTIQHRFGDANLYQDMYGLFAMSSMRIGVAYVPINNLQLGFGLTSYNNTWDINLKYALMRQSEEGGWPISITYYGNWAIDTRDKSNFVSNYDRFTYFHEIMFARKVNDNFSIQVAPTLTYFNNVVGYINSQGDILPTMNNQHFACSFIGRYKLTDKFGIIADYDQPLTQHTTNNPHPNVAGGVEFETSGHSFQLFFSNFGFCLPQLNNFLNQNDYTKKGNYLFGFNITRKFNL